MTTPSLVSGIAYFITNYNLLVAVDARDSHVIWSKYLPVMTFAGKNLTFAHYHAIWFSTQIRNTPLVWINAGNYTIFAFNALTLLQIMTSFITVSLLFFVFVFAIVIISMRRIRISTKSLL